VQQPNERFEVIHCTCPSKTDESAVSPSDQTDEFVNVEAVPSASDALDKLATGRFDCVVSDYELPESDGIAFCEAVRERDPELPFILYTDRGSEAVASDAITAGVTEYFRKGAAEQDASLTDAIQRVLEADSDGEATDRPNRDRTLLEALPGCVVTRDSDGRFTDANQRAQAVLGLEHSSDDGRYYTAPAWEYVGLDGAQLPADSLPYRQVWETGEPIYDFDLGIRWPDGTINYFLVNGAPLFDDEGEVERVVLSLTDVTERTARERDLEQYTDFIDRLLDSIDDVLYVHDEEGTLIRYNEKFSEVAGITGDDADTRTAFDFLPESHHDRASERIREAMDSGHGRLEAPLLTSDGEAIPYEFVANRVETVDGDTQIVGIGRDISELKAREAQLEQYQQIVQHLDDVATIISPEGTIKYVSPAVERVLGYEPAELIGEDGFGYQPPETSEQVAVGIQTVLEDPSETCTVQTQFRRADGSFCWIESTLRNRTEDDIIDGILVSSRDISERVEQKEQTEQRKEQVSQLHEATRDLLAAATPKAAATVASEAAVEILELPLNGIHFYDEELDGLVPTAVSEGSTELFDEVPIIDEGIAWEVYQRGESRIYDDVRNDTEVYNAETPIRSEMYLTLGEYGVFLVSSTETDSFDETDVEVARILAANTEAALHRITREQELRSRERELERQNDRLDEFASFVSHDLRNPLNVAKGRLELARREHDNEHLEYVATAQDRMETLIDDVLALSRQGETIDEKDVVNLESIARDSWQNVETADATRVVETDLRIRADRSRLRQLLENLFRNAVEHGGDDVTVRIGERADGFYVADDGPGVPADDREAVFTAGHSASSGGTGYGLAIVDQIVDGHDWAISITESETGGARFEISGVETVQ